MPNVSVVIPIYNAEKCIRKAIESVLNQTFKDFELILVLDGCTDSSLTVCRSFTDSRIKIVEQKNRGPSAARNKGIQKASGSIIAFLDADDYWETNKIEKHIDHLGKYPEVGISFSCSQFIGQNGEEFSCYQVPSQLEIDLETQLQVNPVGNGSSPVLRMEALKNVELKPGVYFHEELQRCEDYELWARILATTRWKMACLPEPLTNYRLGSSSGSWDPQIHLMSLQKANEIIKGYAPEAMGHQKEPHKAMARFYIARTLLFHGKPFQSWVQCVKGVGDNWKALNFQRTLVWIAATVGMVVPLAFLQWLEKVGFRLLGQSQKKKMKRLQQLALV